jgi:hypothetical protein
MPRPDFTLTDCGSLMLLAPEHPEARRHLTERVELTALWFGNALVVEPRYVPGLLDGLAGEGFTYQGGSC